MSFYNTISLAQESLLKANKDAMSQQERIEDVFLRQGKAMTPWKVHRVFFPEYPITSVRRAITNLTKMGRLVKTKEQVPGGYGKPNYLYIHSLCLERPTVSDGETYSLIWLLEQISGSVEQSDFETLPKYGKWKYEAYRMWRFFCITPTPDSAKLMMAKFGDRLLFNEKIKLVCMVINTYAMRDEYTIDGRRIGDWWLNRLSRETGYPLSW